MFYSYLLGASVLSGSVLAALSLGPALHGGRPERVEGERRAGAGER